MSDKWAEWYLTEEAIVPTLELCQECMPDASEISRVSFIAGRRSMREECAEVAGGYGLVVFDAWETQDNILAAIRQIKE